MWNLPHCLGFFKPCSRLDSTPSPVTDGEFLLRKVRTRDVLFSLFFARPGTSLGLMEQAIVGGRSPRLSFALIAVRRSSDSIVTTGGSSGKLPLFPYHLSNFSCGIHPSAVKREIKLLKKPILILRFASVKSPPMWRHGSSALQIPNQRSLHAGMWNLSTRGE